MDFEANGPISMIWLFENEVNTSVREYVGLGLFYVFFEIQKREFTFFCFVAYVFSNNG